jgi:hypothetical protein
MTTDVEPADLSKPLVRVDLPMNRLQREFRRLYAVGSAEAAVADAPPQLVDSQHRVRAMVIGLARPASWDALATVWHGVQAELELPAPAIAVSGTDSLQLWFSLAEPIALTAAHAFLASLRARFLPDIETSRVELMPTLQAVAPNAPVHAAIVPAEQVPAGQWSAFVASDLASVFAEAPWLDIPPNEEGQGSLLHGLATMKPEQFELACQRLARAQAPPVAPPPARAEAVRPLATGGAVTDEARRFLLRIMDDESVPLALRIEAAKALL